MKSVHRQPFPAGGPPPRALFAHRTQRLNADGGVQRRRENFSPGVSEDVGQGGSSFRRVLWLLLSIIFLLEATQLM